jgi:purine-binding chemotaxis protein CheW
MDTGASPSSAAAGPPSSRREGGAPSSRGKARALEGIHACVFWLGGQRYALDTVDVLEAVTLQQLVPVPLSPPWLLGLTSLRGAPLPVVDLETVLGLPAVAGVGQGDAPQALVLRIDGILLGGRVDRIEAVYRLEEARFEPVASASELRAVRGLLELGRGSVPATLLDHGELARRVGALRFRSKWEEGSEGETRHGAKD